MDSCELMEKLYLYLLWTANNWWRSFTFICCEQLWTDEEAVPVSAVNSYELMKKLYLYLLWTAVNWWRSCTCICCKQLWTDKEAVPVSAVDSCATCGPCARPLELSALHSSPCPRKTFPEIRSQVSLKPAGRDVLKKTKVGNRKHLFYFAHFQSY